VTTLAFETLALEGGLLAPEWLARAAQLAAPHQTEADYAIEDGLLLRDEIGRYWRIAHARWSKMSAGRAAGGDAAVLAREFVVDLLTRCFGFTDLTPTAPVVVGARTYPIGLAAHGGRVPVVVAPLGAGLDTPAAAFGEAGRKRTPYGLCQEYLNADDAALWGLCCDGFTLRILRDNASLTRPAHLEADLARIFREDRFADFSALWLVAHATRFGRAAATAAPVLEIADGRRGRRTRRRRRRPMTPSPRPRPRSPRAPRRTAPWRSGAPWVAKRARAPASTCAAGSRTPCSRWGRGSCRTRRTRPCARPWPCPRRRAA
jgi:hypothetical protein